MFNGKKGQKNLSWYKLGHAAPCGYLSAKKTNPELPNPTTKPLRYLLATMTTLLRGMVGYSSSSSLFGGSSLS